MGGTSTSSSTTKTEPWQPAQGDLKSILGGAGNAIGSASTTPTENSAFQSLLNNAAAGNPFTSGITSSVNSFLSGNNGAVQGAYDNYANSLAPTLSGQYLDPNTNPYFANTTSAITNAVSDQIKGLYAGSGRDPAGAGNFAQTLGTGVGNALAPIFSQNYTDERNNQINAANSLYNAGNSTQSLLANLAAQGINTSQSALDAQNYGANTALAVEAAKRGIPISTLQQIASIVAPIAGLGGTSNTNSSQTMSGAQQFATIAGGIGSLMPKPTPVGFISG